ncbi:HAMP domain-containing histidine kinase [Niastella caeni]|uniref:histidine kinase n=1 Tax=Niastella caeni TaxID=2569763 RepID=A0A4S8H9K4_9BACT|nr:HAMP domain-containing sensor histidine kinase [Niastella caeni]THU31570.1 HAMP domain-containing histidine kinase [Niastella caeni]
MQHKLLNRHTYTLLAAIALFTLGYFLNRYVTDVTSPRYFARLIQNRIQEKEKDFQQLTSDTTLMGSLVDQTYTDATLQGLLDTEKGYGLYIYDETEFDVPPALLFWNTQLILPVKNLSEDSMSSRLERLSNGIYIHTARVLYLRNDRRLIAEALIPVMRKWQYNVETENLQKEFVDLKGATRQVDISNTVTDFPIKNLAGDVLFYLQQNTLNGRPHNTWVILVVIAGFSLLFLFLHQLADYVCRNYGIWYGIALLAGAVGAMRLIVYGFPDILALRQFELFDPSIYGSSYILSSLGDLLINALLLCWVLTFINRRINIPAIHPYPEPWANWLVLVVTVSALVIVTFTFAAILQTMVSDAKISFNVTNFFSLIATPYSFVGFMVLAVLALSYFFMSQILLTVAGKMVGDRNYFMFIIAAAIGLMILSLTGNHSIVELNLYVLLWLLAFMWLMQQRIFAGLNFRLNVSEVLFWLFVFSFSMSAVIIFENRKLELEDRKRFAAKLALQADPTSEHLLSVNMAYIDSNFVVQNMARFSKPQTNAYLKDSIVRKSDLINYKYNIRIFTFDSSDVPLYNDEQASYDTLNTIFQIQGKKTAIPGMRFFERSFDKFAYIFKREINDGKQKLGSIFILADPRRYKTEALTPELFRQNSVLLPEQYSSVYSYAIYDSTRNLILNYNDYAFPTHLANWLIPTEEFERRRNNSFEELWHRPSSDKVVIIARKRNSLIEAITLFAYLFSTFLFLLAFYRLGSIIIRSRLHWSILKQYMQLNIRSQIHSTILMVSLLSFIVIGVATILFFINRYQRNNQDRLTRAMQIMVNQVQSHINQQHPLGADSLFYEPVFNEQMERLIQEISEVHGMDVNLYDTVGGLRVTSNQETNIYTSGVLSTKMNPLAYYRLYHLQQIQTVTNEQVGKLDYLSIYSPIRNERGHAVAFLNIPSYTTQTELKQEISNFVVTVINLNAFIFLIAGGIALVITNRITQSFTIISQKMREVGLRKVNEAIEWKRDDEIGVLVKEYNKMVQKLEESAEALAKSERESAWRQMARQVAHEIKNPLTPMKLSIQYLQKAIDNNSTDVKVLTTNVAKTLVEQIDHLSKIASDFSQFANIGNPKNEVFDLHEMLQSLASLYNTGGNLDFRWNPVEQRVLLFADRTQLNRLFTNLLQNAVEACANRDQRIIRMNEQLNGEYITVSVTDNGDGIPEQTQSRIFTPNFTTKTSGTGLGLAMSKGIVEQAKGEIWFVTKEGAGTTFYVKIPLLRAN